MLKSLRSVHYRGLRPLVRGISYTPNNPNNSDQHVFQPVASRSNISPMRRTIPWLVALRAREKHIEDWYKTHGKDAGPPPSDTSYSYSDVKTRDVVDKSRSDSFTCALLPFKSDPWFMDAYINSSGRLRIGQIFQDLDALAGVIAYRHCSPAEPVIVTASVDRIYMLKRLDDISKCNVTLSGSVTWTGRSSMEITIKAATHTEDFEVGRDLTEQDIRDDEVFLTANFTFVARDPETKKSFPINRLVPRTEQEQVDFVHAEKFNNRKKLVASQTGLRLQPPSEEESAIIHYMWTKQKDYDSDPSSKPSNVVNMSQTKVYSTSIMQPQYRNRHSYMIFGGYLLRQTFELAYACASSFAHEAPRFVSLDSTTFKNPVPVGSVLYLTATVAYTEQTTRLIKTDGHVSEHVPGTLIQVRVDSTVRNLEHGTTTDTGQFTYSYFAATKEGQQPPSLLPQTYNEMMEYLEGRRKAIDTANFYTERRLGELQYVVSE
ncbi:hypothetical protein AWJ20_992 [Sugiyamaella lignohabitans]|uniref:HotDog ACOT-type domain-containing protein n=1 Tax=Sugiyamaella lignohabitans TaxID=796027 RepID=A0A167DBP5_9ASCO|nr:uncharacterized protein AWJ20_992 [Sugiyamaella lignohabitans]ANB12724.1 hypothetical protein AWJ20_992 [Sugiyamaella lignohabitans]